jgi:hypothetical protein
MLTSLQSFQYINKDAFMLFMRRLSLSIDAAVVWKSDPNKWSIRSSEIDDGNFGANAPEFTSLQQDNERATLASLDVVDWM